MKYRKAIGFVDDLFSSFIIFVLCLIWFRYFFSSLILSLALSVVVSIIVSFSRIAFRKRKYNNLTLNKEQRTKMENLMTYLLLSPQEEITTLFNDKIQGQAKGKVIVKDNEVYYLFFENETFTLNNFYRLTKSLPQNVNVQIFANSFEPSLVSMVKDYTYLNIKLCAKDVIYKEYFSDVNIDLSTRLKTEPKHTFLDILKLFVRPENSKGYLFSALYILLACLIIPQKIYYVVFASILLLLAYICSLNKTTQKATI